MKITEKQRRTMDAVVAIQCDKCGKKIGAEREDAEAWIEFQETLSIEFTGGYGSILGDGCRFELDLCQHCVQEVLGPYLRQTRDGYMEMSGNAPESPPGI